jgi:hypothetical protein
MKKNKKSGTECSALPSSASASPKEIQPRSISEEETLEPPSKPKAIPIGRPVKPAKFRAMKKQAERGLAPKVKSAQKDSPEEPVEE